MNKHFKDNERELLKVVTFFKKKSKKLIESGKLGEEHKKVEEAVDRFVQQMDLHANHRALILEQRQYLANLVKDDAACPKCGKKDMLKQAGTEKNEKGWESNRYKCRKCNIQFTWNRPNNPWDMIPYIEELLDTLRLNYANADSSEKEQAAAAIESMKANLDRLKPVIAEHDNEYNRLQAQEAEMEKLIHEFKNTLLIEKIKMDSWDNRVK